jgi:hypothetical protein
MEMNMRALIITSEIRAQIAAAVARAEAKPIPFSVLREGALREEVKHLKLIDRKPGFERPPSEHLLIPIGYRASISIEEQPAGFCRHLSISVDQPGKLPSVEAVKMIAEAYGIKEWDKVWFEEFDPGHSAINILELYQPRELRR